MRNFYSYSNELEGKALVEQIHKEEPDVPIISNSQLMSWDRCEFQWYLGYVEGWDAREKPRALELGTLIHEVLAVWYSTLSREAVVAKMGEHFNKYAFDENALPMLAEETWLVLQYVDNFTPANDRDFEVVATEEHFIIALLTPGRHKFYLQGYLDVRGIDTSTGNMWIWDHKSSVKFQSLTEIRMDPQLPLYAAAYSQNNIPIFGVCINQLNTYQYKKKEGVLLEQLFRREYNYLTETHMMNLLHSIGLAVDDMLESRGTVARRRLRRDCSRCRYHEPCLNGLKGFDIENSLAVDFVKTKNTNSNNSKKEVASSGARLNIHL